MKTDLPPIVAPAASQRAGDPNDPLWFKDAVIYQLHVKAFYDSNGDGIGDFRGLTEKLDYILELGVNTIWLQPFYPSPMLDDGYDVADYTNVYPAYGTRADFRQFVREAHRRGLKVITELIINHTSDQHAWFQAARRAPKGSTKRDYYVWSDDPNKYAGTRIIFTDTESSNWAWDGTAQSHYWHRFFSHQPDLNFDNPHVLKAIFRVMRFWLDAGVDGFRLDAIPYLVEREGTENENLPETHEIIRRIRASMDSRYRNRILLAEANLWPEEVRQYFGNGDECQMAYHFPLMPRVYMSIAMEDRHPIVEIMAQTPSIPDDCQWAIFLRNHDELTLEMVTDRERDYMYRIFANDPRMRVNVGIRRRLAPLMDNSRTQIELISFLLMTLPGAPILYYGDEIGMGDNIYLGDRNSVRTPMQWSPDRNAGFSRADPQRLYLPPVMDALYGYQTVNVEAQVRSASSLLHWTRRMVAMRRSFRAFSRGSLSFLSPGNRKVLAFVREYEGETVLCVANLSRVSQAVELDLSRFDGRVPVEVMGKEAFPPVGKLPYLLTLSGHGYFAFRLAADAPPPVWHDERMPYSALPVLVLSRAWKDAAPGALHVIDSLIVNMSHDRLRDEILLPYLRKRPWFGARTLPVTDLRFEPVPHWTTPEGNWLMAIMCADVEGHAPQRYFFPLALDWESRDHDPLEKLGQWSFAKVRQRGRIGVLYGAFGNPGFARTLARANGVGQDVELGSGRLRFTKTSRYAEFADGIEEEIRIPSLEQSNTGVFFGSKLFLKGYRRLCPGVNPEVEMGRFLTERGHTSHVAPLLGAVEYIGADGSEPVTIAILQKFMRNQGDAWTWTLGYLDRMLSHPAEASEAAEVQQGFHVPQMGVLGQRVAELHRALAQPSGDPAFEPVAMTAEDFTAWRDRVAGQLEQTIDRIARERDTLPFSLQPFIDEFVRARAALRNRVRAIRCESPGLVATRIHGNLHLGQVLVAESDFVIIDFEGHVSRPMGDWRRKHSPLHDVAGMLTSFGYAAYAAGVEAQENERDISSVAAMQIEQWQQAASKAFLDGYREAAAGLASAPADDASLDDCLTLCIVERAMQELIHEMENRPEWMQIPLRQLLTVASA